MTDPDAAAAFEPAKVIARLGVSLLVVWPRAAAPAVAAAKRGGLHVRCGFGDDLSFKETFTLFRHMAAMGVDEMACGRPDWMGRMADEYYAASKPAGERHQA